MGVRQYPTPRLYEHIRGLPRTPEEDYDCRCAFLLDALFAVLQSCCFIIDVLFMYLYVFVYDFIRLCILYCIFLCGYMFYVNKDFN